MSQALTDLMESVSLEHKARRDFKALKDRRDFRALLALTDWMAL